MQSYIFPDREQWPSILERPSLDNSQLEATVSQVLQRIQVEGDQAIKDYTQQFDGLIPLYLDALQDLTNSSFQLGVI